MEVSVGRRIVTVQYQSNSDKSIDGYFDRVMKYIPGDIIGSWVAVTGLIESAGDDVPVNMILWTGFIIGVVLTAVWTLKQTREKNKRPAMTQTIVSAVAFIVWVFALGSPFSTLEFYRPLYGSLALILYSLVVGLIIPSEDSIKQN